MVLLVVDGLPMRQITQVRDQLAPDGFARFLTRRSGSLRRTTATGTPSRRRAMPVMLTGAYPQRTGIISNEWRDLKTGEQVYCTQDPAHTYIDSPTPRLAGTSPRNLRSRPWAIAAASTRGQGDRHLRQGSWRHPARRPKGTAYMYMAETGRLRPAPITWPSTRPGSPLFNAGKPADAFKKTWAPLAARGGLRAFGARWPNPAGRHGQWQSAAGRRGRPDGRTGPALLRQPVGQPLATS